MTSNRVVAGVLTCAVVAVLEGGACSSSSGGAGATPPDAAIDALVDEPCLDTSIEPATGSVVPGQSDAIHFVVHGPGTPPAPTILMWTATGGTLPSAGEGETSIVWTAPETTGTYTIELTYEPVGGALMCVDQLVLYVVTPTADGGGDDASSDDGGDDGSGDDSSVTGDDASGDDSSTTPDASLDAGVDASLDSSAADATTDASPPADGGSCARDGAAGPSGPPTNVTTNVSSAGVGAAILVSGTNLDSTAYGATLTFPPGISAPAVEQDANGIWFDVPAGASTGFQNLTYTTCAGSTTTTFTVDATPAPSVTGFTPTSATSGQTIVVTGQYFTGATKVLLTYFQAPATYALPIEIDSPLVVSDTALTFVVPTIPNAEFRYVLVVTPEGAGASAGELELMP